MQVTWQMIETDYGYYILSVRKEKGIYGKRSCVTLLFENEGGHLEPGGSYEPLYGLEQLPNDLIIEYEFTEFTKIGVYGNGFRSNLGEKRTAAPIIKFSRIR